MKAAIINVIRKICGTKSLSENLAKENECLKSELKDLKAALKAEFEGLKSEMCSQRDDLFFNMCQLHSGKQKVFLSNGGEKVIALYNRGGKLNFCPSKNEVADIASGEMKTSQNLPRLFIVTLPKSGTYFWGRILQECGYEDIEIHADGTCFSDYRGHTIKEKLDMFTDYTVKMPFSLQTQLIESGQYLLGHLPFYCVEFIKDEKFIVTVRDLRTVFISLLRFAQRRLPYAHTAWYSLGCTEEALYTFICSPEGQELIVAATELCRWVQNYPEHVLRFEDLSQPETDGYAKIVNYLGQQTGLDSTTVTAAIERARGTETKTWSGKLSVLEDFWSERIEEQFRLLGADVLNEQLGYDRDWKK